MVVRKGKANYKKKSTHMLQRAQSYFKMARNKDRLEMKAITKEKCIHYIHQVGRGELKTTMRNAFWHGLCVH